MRDSAPSLWEELSLGDLVTRLVNGGTPPTSIAAYWQGSIPWITGADFTPSGLSEFRRFVSDVAVRETATNVIAKGELLLVTRTGVGKLAIAPCDVAISQDITGVYPDRQRVAVEFLYHRMRQGVEDLRKLNQGTSINGIVRNDLGSYRIALPPISTQQRIAEILSTVDEAIEQTEALIAKTQQIKAGLMHDLFTRGVTPDGKLRPPREEAPNLYKQSPLGWIPKEWDLRACSEICSSVIDCKNRTPPIAKAGHPVIRTPNVRDGEFVCKDLTYTDAVSYLEWTARGRPVPGDVVITREAPFGEVCMIPEDLEAPCLGQRMMLYRPDPNQVLGSFLLQMLQSMRVQKYLNVVSGGSTVGHVRVGDIRSLRVPWAPMPEQKAIAPKLEAVCHQLTTLRTEVLKLRQLKAGLMHDLLTGRVPVSIAGAAEAEEAAADV